MTAKLQVLILFILAIPTLSAQDVVINEILASSDSISGISDFQGQYDDWIELYNTTSSSIDLGGWGLSDDVLNLDKWTIPASTTIEPDAYLIIWCDNDSMGLHTNFRLDKEGEVLTPSNMAGVVINQISYTNLSTNISHARVPNGTGSFMSDEPSFNTSNDAEYSPFFTSSSIVINEVLAASDSTGSIVDASGKVEDWTELYNLSSSPINLYGYFLSDDPANRFKWKFPIGSIIQPDSYLIVWCDNDQEESGLHCNFNLNSSGESMILSYHNGAVVDLTSWPLQTANTSYARLPNGTGSFQTDLTPSFNENNGIDISIEDFVDLRVSAYPSPVKDILNLSIDPSLLTHDLRFKLQDMTGKAWLSESLSHTDHRIDIPSTIPTGLYFIIIENNMEHVIRKILLE